VGGGVSRKKSTRDIGGWGGHVEKRFVGGGAGRAAKENKEWGGGRKDQEGGGKKTKPSFRGECEIDHLRSE